MFQIIWCYMFYEAKCQQDGYAGGEEQIFVYLHQ